MSVGWLAREPKDAPPIEGFPIDREKFSTRFEEYAFVLRTLALEKPGVVVDAGSGFNPEIHNLSYMLENKGWYVVATDANYESLNMPQGKHSKIVRWVEDMCLGWYTRGLAADAWTCVSTFEHLQPQHQIMAMETAFQTVRPGGIAVVTVDLMAPSRLAALLRFGGFQVGPEVPFFGEHHSPRVAWGVGRKPLGGG